VRERVAECRNTTECSLPLSFFSRQQVVLEVPQQESERCEYETVDTNYQQCNTIVSTAGCPGLHCSLLLYRSQPSRSVNLAAPFTSYFSSSYLSLFSSLRTFKGNTNKTTLFSFTSDW